MYWYQIVLSCLFCIYLLESMVNNQIKHSESAKDLTEDTKYAQYIRITKQLSIMFYL